ncbi:acetylserotonin O-methyltransferase-like isoform X2 [Salvia splendens]|uniref:acetylserotonin O-methyltransferase-like isoform X2 n=1 Tax=Salvia splendens TaxID=180675 RepID=UPI001C25DC91|nr:acetylserotonin O-methyltransferase-like isoform X2 [Salvia splendens]
MRKHRITSKNQRANSIDKMDAKSIKEEKAEVEIWQYIFGFTPMAVVKCAIELEIADAVESHGGAVSLPDLASAVACSPSALGRIMRYLTHRGFFELKESTNQYANTPLSLLLLKSGVNTIAPLLVMEASPWMLAPWHGLSASASRSGGSGFKAAHGEEIWEFGSHNPAESKLFNDGMACHARRAVSEIVEQYGEVFEGIDCLVDVGGGDGTTLHCIVEACPWIRGINYDLPHVVSAAQVRQGVEHVAGDMFEYVPNADAAFIKILTKCREAIPKETGKVIIAEAVIVEGEEDKYRDVKLALDVAMLSHTEKGKERTIEEWDLVIKGAGFSSFTVQHIGSIISIIEAYP